MTFIHPVLTSDFYSTFSNNFKKYVNNANKIKVILLFVMVYHCQHTHIYHYPFQQYVQIELNGRLETNDSCKTSVEVLEKARDSVDGNERIILKSIWRGIIPQSLQQAANLNIPEIEFEEELWIDESQQGYWRRFRNTTMDNYFQIWQASTSLRDQGNSNWTYSEEEGGVEVFSKDRLSVILEDVIGKFIDKCIKTNIERTEINLAEAYNGSKSEIVANIV